MQINLEEMMRRLVAVARAVLRKLEPMKNMEILRTGNIVEAEVGGNDNGGIEVW